MSHGEAEDILKDRYGSKTLAEALDRIPLAPESGMRFIGFGPEERYFTYRELYREACRRGAMLQGLGLGRGDRLVLMISEAHEFIMSFMGCVLAGIVPVPISPMVPAKGGEHFLSTAARIIDDSGAKALLVAESSRGTAGEVLGRSGGEAGLMLIETAFAGEAPELIRPGIRPEDLCFLQYTSGSTTSPRGVMVTHANLMANIRAFMGPAGLDVGPEDVGITWLPLYHDMGLIGMVLGPLIYIGPIVVMATSSFVRDPRLWLRMIDKHRATITYAPNFAYSQVIKRLRDGDLETLDLSCVRVAGCGAEPIHAATLRAFAEKLAPAGFRHESFLPSYGMAESTLAITIHQTGKPLRTELVDLHDLKHGRAVPAGGNGSTVMEIVSCGFPLPEHELAIISEDGTILPERSVGEVVFRGPSVTSGYYRNVEATAESWRDGWLHTGDLGFVADGELFVCGRSKELIIIRGANYYPQDIESIVRDLPGVKRGNVVAFSVDDGREERLVIVAEADPRESGGLRQAIAAAISGATGLEVHGVMLVAAGTLLRTTSGKLQRRKMKQLYEQGELEEIG